MKCPLCQTENSNYYSDHYFYCNKCQAVYLDKESYLDSAKEKARYLEHNNDVNCLKYQKFVSPITDYIFANYGKADLGLDFGSGTGPVISKILTDKDYNIKQYDPFFSHDKSLLDQKYDYIASCEVVEHFHNPNKDFLLLKKLLKNGGKLLLQTHIYDENKINFKNWYYQNDLTHVFIYQYNTIKYIAAQLGFNILKLDERFIVLEKPLP
ncbi:methyltransferase domain-containing protein [bacterium]|nr:methyltransferase domain-containing protein [bacterium]